MSQESANQFLDRLETDEDFATSLAELREDPAAVQAAIKDAGYDVTPEEVRTAFLDRFGSQLTEEQLAAVAGGVDEGAAIGISVGAVGGVVVIGLAASAAAI